VQRLRAGREPWNGDRREPRCEGGGVTRPTGTGGPLEVWSNLDGIARPAPPRLVDQRAGPRVRAELAHRQAGAGQPGPAPVPRAGQAHGPDRAPAAPRRASAAGLPGHPGHRPARRAPAGLRLRRQLRGVRAPPAAPAPGPGPRSGDPLRDRPGPAGPGGLGAPGRLAARGRDGGAQRHGRDPRLQPGAGHPLRRRPHPPDQPGLLDTLPGRPGRRHAGGADRPRPGLLRRGDRRWAGDPGRGVGRPGRTAGDRAEGLPAVPGADQGQGRADDPRAQGEPAALAEWPAAAAGADPGRLRRAGPPLDRGGGPGAAAPHHRADRRRGLGRGAAAPGGDPGPPAGDVHGPAAPDRRGEHVQVRELAEYEAAR
jgi:hypothetical protein